MVSTFYEDLTTFSIYRLGDAMNRMLKQMKKGEKSADAAMSILTTSSTENIETPQAWYLVIPDLEDPAFLQVMLTNIVHSLYRGFQRLSRLQASLISTKWQEGKTCSYPRPQAVWSAAEASFPWSALSPEATHPPRPPAVPSGSSPVRTSCLGFR